MKTIAKINSISVLIPDGENPFVMRVVYCLSKYKNIKIHLLSSKKYFPMRFSRHIHKVYFTQNNQDAWLASINRIIDKCHIDYVMPVSEAAIRSLIKNRTLIDQSDKLLELSDLHSYNKAIDKSELAKHLELNNIPAPKTQILDSYSKDFLDLKSTTFPVIAKPAVGSGGMGIKILKTKTQLKSFIEHYEDSCKYVLQEFIKGYDIDCSVLCIDGKIIAHTVQKGNLFDNQKFSPAIGLQFEVNEELFNTVKLLMSSLNWSGVAHIDLRYDSRAKNYKVIEINGRFWSSVEASLLAGVNFPLLYLLSKTVETLPYCFKKIQYLNLKGIIKKLKTNPKPLLNFNFLKNNTPLFFSLNDPLPVLLMGIVKMNNLTKSKLKI